ncbi:nascent polypeptide-associated complex subunit alpha, muscle-specific form-like [Mesoplodon densirostris]|uniref:nascent polypeptide-associated complex subunit alpha, muscle-specific form-like n=1 Tax=Mesoplodon densirostris TaxID=48708 RepID=UPI0028DCAF2A|nr:nascent polypeptide-associated complex subunit alpha, muscle-specific form-like [Mesoplodon densirostris]
MARSLTGVCRRLRGPPPTSRPSAGREPACLSRPIYHRHTNNTRESAETLPRSPCPHGSRRTERWSVTAPAGSGWDSTGSGCPERTAGPARPRPTALPPARLPGHSHSSARRFLSCLIPNWAGSTGVVLREQEIGEGGGDEQPGSYASGSELKTQSRRPRAGRRSGLRGPRGAARNAPPGQVTRTSRSPLAAHPSPLPRGALRSPGRGAPACSPTGDSTSKDSAGAIRAPTPTCPRSAWRPNPAPPPTTPGNPDGILITAISPLPPRGEIMPKINTGTDTAKPRPDNRSGVEWEGSRSKCIFQVSTYRSIGGRQLKCLPHKQFCWPNRIQHLPRPGFGLHAARLSRLRDPGTCPLKSAGGGKPAGTTRASSCPTPHTAPRGLLGKQQEHVAATPSPLVGGGSAAQPPACSERGPQGAAAPRPPRLGRGSRPGAQVPLRPQPLRRTPSEWDQLPPAADSHTPYRAFHQTPRYPEEEPGLAPPVSHPRPPPPPPPHDLPPPLGSHNLKPTPRRRGEVARQRRQVELGSARGARHTHPRARTRRRSTSKNELPPERRDEAAAAGVFYSSFPSRKRKQTGTRRPPLPASELTPSRASQLPAQLTHPPPPTPDSRHSATTALPRTQAHTACKLPLREHPALLPAPRGAAARPRRAPPSPKPTPGRLGWLHF